MLALVSFFACVEKLSSIANLVSVEKDWVSGYLNTFLRSVLTRIGNCRGR